MIITKLINLTNFGESIYNKCNIQIKTSQLYIKEINSGIIFLSQDAILYIKKSKKAILNEKQNNNQLI